MGYGVSKLLDGVLDYVGKALKFFDDCEELHTLLRDIKPFVASAEAKQSSEALEASGEAVEQWLKHFGSLLKEAERELSRVLGSVPKKSLNVRKRKKHGDLIRKLTERIRLGAYGCPFAILSVVTNTKSDTTALISGVEGIRNDLRNFGLSQQGKAAPQHPLVQILNDRTGADGRCPMVIETADTHSPQFHVP